MAPFVTAVVEGGPWVVLLLVLAAVAFAMVRGHLVRGSEVDRMERQREKDTDRVLALYVKQIDQLVSAAARKDETIAKQDEQIERLLAGHETATQALDKIVKEAERRGFFQP